MEETGHPTQVLLRRESFHHPWASMERTLRDKERGEFSSHGEHFPQPLFLEAKAWKTWMQSVAPLVLLAELIPADGYLQSRMLFVGSAVSGRSHH